MSQLNIPTVAPTATQPPTSALSPEHPKSLLKQTRVLQVLGGTVVTCGVIAIVLGLQHILALEHGQRNSIPLFIVTKLSDLSSFYFAILGIFSTYIIFLIVYCFWIFRAKTNMHLLGAEGMKYSPGWSVGWAFIPIANSVMPFVIMNELWKASKNPENWKEGDSSGLVGFIWLSVFIGGIVSRFAFREEEAMITYDEHILNTMGETGAILLDTVAAILIMVFVTKICNLQKQHMMSHGYHMI